MMNFVHKNSAFGWKAGAAAAVLAPTLAYAHTGVGPTSGLASGFAHPMMGLDHIAAMVAVGMLAAQRGGRSLWALPLCFVGVMALGGALGMAGMGLPFVEFGIVASVIVLGAVIAASVKMPVVAGALLVAAFAVFHGHAHGTEIVGAASRMAYGVGFMSATALLHTAGIGLGLLAGKLDAPRALRYAGGVTAVLGVYLMVA